MGKLFEIEATLIFAECELQYLIDLIIYFEKSGYYYLFESRFLALKLFRNNFYTELDELKGLMEINRERFLQNENALLLLEIYVRSETLREVFKELHNSFLKLLDEVIKKRILKHAKKIKATITLAENSMANLMTNENDKSNLENLTDILKINSECLSEKLKSINKLTAGMSIEGIYEDFGRGLNEEEYNIFIQQQSYFYSTQLIDLHDRITNKFNFAFSATNTPNGICEEILKVRDKSNNIRYYSSHNLWKKNIADVDNKALDSIINFISVNISFFIAPFTHRTFQYWGTEHFNELKEISDELKKYLNSNERLDEFYKALQLLKNKGKDNLLRNFLESMENTGFLEFLRNCIEYPYPIIDEWNYYATFNLK